MGDIRMNYKQQVIADNITARENEIAVYDINIANYEHVIEHADADMAEFVEGLRQRIADEQRERRKAELILNALRAQQGE